jgi:hypothetical protein
VLWVFDPSAGIRYEDPLAGALISQRSGSDESLGAGGTAQSPLRTTPKGISVAFGTAAERNIVISSPAHSASNGAHAFSAVQDLCVPGPDAIVRRILCR